MAKAKSGRSAAFWNAAAAGADSVSNVVKLGRGYENLAIYVTTNGATTISLEAAHSGDVNTDGTLSNANAGNWGQVIYLDIPVQRVAAGAGSFVLLVPDFGPSYIRLRTSAAVTLTAGFEAAAG